MIILKITNASEVVREKAGKLFEKMTPDQIDQNLVESQVRETMIEQLKVEGLKGEISIVKGLEIEKENLITTGNFKIKDTKTF